MSEERLRERIRELEQAEAFLSSVLESTPGFVTLVDREGKFLYVNRCAPGLSPEDVYGTAVYDWVPPDYHPVVRATLEGVWKTGRSGRYQTLGHGPHGTLACYDTQVGPVLDDAGQVTCLAMVSTDVTHHRLVERQLRESQEKLELAVRGSGMGLWTWDAQRDEVVWDARVAEMWGVAPARAPRDLDEYLGFVHADDRELVRETMARALEERRFDPFVHRLEERDDGVRWVMSLGSVFEEDGLAVRISGGVLDISHQRTLEDQLHRSSRLESLGRLAGGVAHDFNNLLTVVLSNCDQLRHDEALGEPQREVLGEVIAACGRATELTRQLLAFGRRQLLSPRTLDLNQVVRGVQPLLARLLPENVSFALELGAGLPPVHVDPSQLERAITNLVANARDALPEGGEVALTTALASQPLPAQLEPGAYVTLTVRDSGEGMSAKVLQRVFEPFFSTKGDEGAGLGLATTLGIVEQSGGTIVAESEPGKGTRFTLYLPARRRSTPHSAAQVGKERPTPSECCPGGLILVVEDEPHVQRVVCRQLEHLGQRVLKASSAEEALELFAQHEQELAGLLTDLVLTGMGGDALAEIVCGRRPDLPVVVMTGYAPDHSRLRQRAPRAELLPKPFTLEALREALNEAAAKAAR